FNLLYARGPRLRVEYEMLRDLSLAAGGLLSGKIGGPSVMPPQPPGIWEHRFGFYDLRDFRWKEATGEYRYRRCLYTFLPLAALVKHGRVEATGLSVDQLAAWTVVANVLLNMDETLTKG